MNSTRLTQALAACPLVAILRGIRPDEAVAVGEALVDCGFQIIEIPLNSPQPFDSIARMVEALPGNIVIGAGTVLTTNDVDRLVAAGGQLMVSPNVDPEVIGAAHRAGVACLPGFVTPTEAFGALQAGATGLKLFPAESFGPGYLKALKAVLPADVPVLPVGGIGAGNMAPWVEVGAAGFGTGSGLFRPGMTVDEVCAQAQAYVAGVKFAGLGS